MEKYKVYVAGEKETKEITKEEIVEELRRTFWDIGGFCLRICEKVPEFVVLTYGRRPSLRYEYTLNEWVYTDAELELIAKKRVYDYPTTDDTSYKYRVKNASFIIKVRLYGHDYEGEFVYSDRLVEIYGNCPFLSKLEELHKELEIET